MSEEIKAGDRLDKSLWKYFWEVSPVAGRKKTVHDFLSKIDIFQNLSDFELLIFAKYLHKRTLQTNEIVVKENSVGHAFYMVFQGQLKVYIRKFDNIEESEDIHEDNYTLVTELEKYNYFGELALIQDKSKRKGTAVCIEPTTVLALYRSDFDEILESYPKIGAKVMGALSQIVVRRLHSTTQKLQEIKKTLNEHS